nr:WD40 repeat domain-containing protein [Planctomycetota bacterium]
SDLCREALSRDKADRPASVDRLAEGIRRWQAQSRIDREVDGWLRDAETSLDEAEGLDGRARIATLDRVLVACSRILDARPDHERAQVLMERADQMRRAALEARHRAERRRLLTRAGGLLLVVGAIVAIFVARELDRRRDEAVVAQQEAEANLFRARIRGLVASSAEAGEADPMLALLLARRAVRQSDPPSAAAISRLYAALVSSRERARFDGHEAEVRSARFAPAGDAVVTASEDGTARIWPLDGGAPVVLRQGEPLSEARFSPSGRHVLVRTANGKSASLWDRKGVRIARLEGHTGPLRSARFSRDGERILTASEDGTARLWDLAGAEQARLSGHRAPVNDAVFSPRGYRILTCSADATARIWDLEGEQQAKYDGHTQMTGAVFAPRREEILVSFLDGTSKLWSEEGEEWAEFRGTQAQFSSSGDRILSVVPWNKLCVHDRGGTLLATFSTPGGAASAFAFLPGQHRVVVGCYDSIVRIWDPTGVRSTVALAGHTGWTESIAFSAVGDRILTASRDGSVRLWEAEGNAGVALHGHAGWIDSAQLSPMGTHVITAARDGVVRLWDRQGRLITKVPYATWSAATFSPTGEQFVACTSDSVAHIRDLEGRKMVALRGHRAPIMSLVFTRDGKEVVTASKDHTVRRWSAVDGQELAAIPRSPLRPQYAIPAPDGDRILVTWIPPRPIQFVKDGVGATLHDRDGGQLAELGTKVRAAAFSPNGARIVTGSYDGIVEIHDGRTGQRLASWQGHASSVLSCRFAPDGESVVTAADDMTARLWDLEGNERAVLRGHRGSVMNAVFAPDGTYVLTHSVDRTARLWGLDGRPLATLQHDGKILRTGVSPDGLTILTASFDGAARLWPVEPVTLLETADARVTRELSDAERERYADLLGE